jgi:hypothetical protein
MYVFGNGESRTSVNIDNLSGIKIGCNAIMRDYKMDHLICVDRKMVREAITTEYKSNIYTRENWIDEFHAYGIMSVPKLPYKGHERPDEPFQWGSGPYAVLLACQLSNDIKLIGFDLHSKDQYMNNIYKDTTNYNNSDHHYIDPRYWIHQIGVLMMMYPSIKFKIYQTANFKLPNNWKLPNVSVDTFDNL